MIRFSYSQFETKLSCSDCDNKRGCKKLKYRSIKTDDICDEFVKRKIKPTVRITQDDYSQLLNHLSHWNIVAKGVINQQVIPDCFRTGIPIEDSSTNIFEAEIFIDINNIFIEYLLELKDMLRNSEAILEILLQTVYSVDSETKIVTIYTEDEMLEDRIKSYLTKTEYTLKKGIYENILGIGVKKFER